MEYNVHRTTGKREDVLSYYASRNHSKAEEITSYYTPRGNAGVRGSIDSSKVLPPISPRTDGTRLTSPRASRVAASSRSGSAPRERSRSRPSSSEAVALGDLSDVAADVDGLATGLSSMVSSGQDFAAVAQMSERELSSEVSRLRKDVSTAIVATKEALAKEAAEKRRLQKNHDLLMEQLHKVNNEKAGAQGKAKELDMKLKDLEDKMANFIPRNNEAESQLARDVREKESTLSQILTEKRHLLAEKTGLAAENDTLRAQLSYLRRASDGVLPEPSAAAFSTVSRRLEATQGDKDALSMSLSASKTDLVNVTSKLHTQASQAGKIDGALKDAKSNYDNVVRQLSYERQAHEKAMAQVQTDRDTYAKEARAARQALENQVKALTDKLAQFEHEVARRDDERERAISKAEAESQRLQVERKELERLVASGDFAKDNAIRSRADTELRMERSSTDHRQEIQAIKSEQTAQVNAIADAHRLNVSALQQKRVSEIESLKEQASKARKERDDAVTLLRERLAAVTAQAQDAAVREMQTTSVLVTEVRKLQARYNELEAEKMRLQREVQTEQETLDAERRNTMALRTQVGQLDGRRVTLDSKLEGLEDVISRERHVAGELNVRIAQMDEVKASLEGAIHKYKGNLDEDKTALRDALDHLSEVKSDKSARENAIRMLFMQVDKEHHTVRELEVSVQHLQTQLDTERSAQVSHEDMVKRIRQDIDETKRAHTASIMMKQAQLDEERKSREATQALLSSLQVQLGAYKTAQNLP